jgi:NB-ARC domain-containing protein
MAIFKQIKSKSIRVIPLLLAKCDIPCFLQEKNIIDFRDINEDKYQTGLKEIFTTIARQNNVEGLKEIEFGNKNSINYTKPKVFRDETSIFLGREEMIEQISSTLLKSKHPISLVGEGGVGKSALAYKIIHKCEDEFDARVTIYFDTNLTYRQFLSTIAEGLDLPRKETDIHGQEDLQDLLLSLLDFCR